MKKFKILVFTPAGSCDVTLAIAATRAGGIGIFNTELAEDHAPILDRLDYLAQMAGPGFGVKLSSWDRKLTRALASYTQKGLEWLILDDHTLAEHRQDVAHFKARNPLHLLAETSRTQWPGDPLDDLIDGLILKGNESGGFVGENSSFIMLQKWQTAKVPLFIRGGMSPHMAAACSVLGVKGCVLDSQLLLLEESHLGTGLASLLKNFSGSETALVGDPHENQYFRVLVRPGFEAAKKFCKEGNGKGSKELAELVKGKIDWNSPRTSLLPLGQDACYAADWQRTYGHMSQVIRAIESAVGSSRNFTPFLIKDSPLAQELGIPYPLVQGPMARISDNPEFAGAVSRNGGLPVIACSLVNPDILNTIFEKTAQTIGKNCWGVGLLGFAPENILKGHLGLLEKHKPQIAIVAGGRPDQVRIFEKAGIQAYMHLPSAELIPFFLKEGGRRFIFEGNECGGHIGPLGGFTLWGRMIARLIDELKTSKIDPNEIRILFAGGIHDAYSSALIQALAAPLSNMGIKIGVIMGSGYIFTKEIVDTGAIVPMFQEQVLKCDRTITLESAPGHISRCAYTEFARTFITRRKEMLDKNMPADLIRTDLDDLVLGKLRVASKGCERMNGEKDLRVCDRTYQAQQGMYMIGQLATLCARPTDIKTLHDSVTKDAAVLLKTTSSEPEKPAFTLQKGADPADIAIIGMSNVLPKAADTDEFWDNILSKVNALTQIPAHRWDWRLYYDKDRYAKDKVYSKWGGFLDDFPFDPTRYGIPPNSIKTVDPMQLMALEIAHRALEDAGYTHRPFDREMTSVIVGSSSSGDVGVQYGLRSELPRFTGNLPESVADRLPEWSEDTFAGILANVTAGRIANRLDLGGLNFTIDAACASSMAAIHQAVNELTAKRSNMVITGGVDTVQGPFSYLCFSKTQALSPTGNCRTFDAEADGIVISEGIAMLVLKRLKDAQRDGDKIYAVIKGVGGSSDGKGLGLTAPRPSGQLRSMHRAYAQAGFGPETVSMFEAHGTGTVAGDTAELESTIRLIKEAGGKPAGAMIGSIKTMVGHTKAAAGATSLVKTALALHHKVLPPHLGVENPNPVFKEPDCPLYLIDQARPWLSNNGTPRRASVSAFGFGGTNFHVAMEEYQGEYRPWLRKGAWKKWPAELCLFFGRDRDTLAGQLRHLKDQIHKIPELELRDIAHTLALHWKREKQILVIVAKDTEQLAQKIKQALAHMEAPEKTKLPQGVYTNTNQGKEGKLAVLFSGQGSQYTGMMQELSVVFPALAHTLESADHLLGETFEKRFGKATRLSDFIFPRANYDETAQKQYEKALTRTEVAQPALGAVEAGLWQVMTGLCLAPDMLAGHSYGEFTALYASQVYDFNTLMHISETRGRLIADLADQEGGNGQMAAVHARRDYVNTLVQGIDGVWPANDNGPEQVIVSGSAKPLATLMEKMKKAGINYSLLNVSAAFHSPLMASAQAPLSDLMEKMEWMKPGIPVYSNTTGDLHPDRGNQIKKIMADHLVNPVEFQSQIEAMYRDGARIFLELGPKSILTGLVRRILNDRPYTAIPIDGHGSGLTGMLHAVGQLVCAGIDLDLTKLFEDRECLKADFDDMSVINRRPALPGQVWMLNGSRARRAKDPSEPVGVSVDSPSPGEQRPATPCPAFRNVPDRKAGLQQTTDRPRFQSTLREKTPNIKDDVSMTHNDHPPLPHEQAVMADYFAMMQKFLETQERVMTMYMTRESSQRLNRNSRPRPLQQVPVFPGAQHRPGAGQTIPDVLQPQAPASSRNLVHPPPSEAGPTLAKEQTQSLGPVQTNEDEVDREKITQALIKIVEDKTGYPAELIDFNQKLETDLGIDSIKRTQIVGELLKTLPESLTNAMKEEEKSGLATQPTFGQMMDLLCSTCLKGDSPVPFPEAGMEQEAGPASRPFRHTMEAHTACIDILADRKLNTGLFLISQDLLGVAHILSDILVSRGCSVSLIPRAALAGKEAIKAWWQSVPDKDQSITGIIHLGAVGSDWLAIDASMDEYRKQLQINEKSFFLLLNHLSDRIKQDAHLVSASSLGGYFGRKSGTAKGLSLQGGGPGLLKSLKEERPGLRVRAIDLDPDMSPEELAQILLAEIELVGGRQEVGYPAGIRTIFKTVARTMDIPSDPEKSDPEKNIKDNQVLLVTGGGKGVTAEVVRGLAKKGNVLVLTGRSRLPSKEPAQTRSLSTRADLRAHFISQIREKKMKLTPAEIESEINGILNAREMVNNIADFKARGAMVEYFAVDVTNQDAMAEMIETIYATHGKISGVVHGAGVIEDKFLSDKTPESWSRVVETKITGLLLLLKHLKHEELNFFTVMSSVAGRYGNSGQTDYATANELMNRICCQLKALWEDKVRVSALCWGPWGPTRFGQGMVTQETADKFAQKGVELVSVENGSALFLSEVGARDEVEVICGIGTWEEHEAYKGRITRGTLEKKIEAPGPLLGKTRICTDGKGEVFTIEFALGENHRYLMEHVFDGIPVLPAAAALEIMAEGACALWPGLFPVEALDHELLKGIQVEDRVQIFTLVLKPRSGGQMEARIQSMAGNNIPRVHYRAKLVMGKKILKKEKKEIPVHDEKELTLDTAYNEFLFHGPRFQVIREINGLSRTGACAQVVSTAPEHWMENAQPYPWIFDPAVVDAAAQMATLWTRAYMEETALPAKFSRIKKYCQDLPEKMTMCFEKLPDDQAHFIHANVYFLDQQNNKVMAVEGLECISSDELNRLGGTQKLAKTPLYN